MITSIILIISYGKYLSEPVHTFIHGLRQDLETGCPKVAIMKFRGVLIFKRDTIYSDYNHGHVFTCNILIQYHGNYIQVKISILCLKFTF